MNPAQTAKITMLTNIPLTNDDKIEICRAAAKLIIKQKINRGYQLNELMNEGFIHIDTQLPAKAYRQARMYMLQLVNRSGIGKRVEATRKSKNPENEEMQVFVNVDKREPRVTSGLTDNDLIDIRDALCSLSREEWLLIQERFMQDMTFEQMAPLHGKKYSTSIKFQVDKILMKLKGWLSR